MFIIYAKPSAISDNYEFSSNLSGLIESIKSKTPNSVEMLAKGVWLIEEVEDLRFIATLGQHATNTGIEFYVKGPQPR